MNYRDLMELSSGPQVKEFAIPELASVKFESIINAFKLSPGTPNVVLNAFIGGSPQSIVRSELDDLSSLRKSLRLTNVQLLDPGIRHFCQTVYEQTGEVFSANLYFTPNRNAQGFEMHSDAQNTLVYQLEGEKEWTFLKDQDGFVREKWQTLNVLKSYNKGECTYQEVPVTIKTHQCLVFPYCLLHRVRNQQLSRSVHLTFAWERPTVGALIKYLLEELFPGEADNYFARVNKSETVSKLQNLRPDYYPAFLKDFAAKQLLRIQTGRPY